MHPEQSAMMSSMVMEERHREAAARRRLATEGPRRPGVLRTRIGTLLVRIGTRLEAPPPAPSARRA